MGRGRRRRVSTAVLLKCTTLLCYSKWSRAIRSLHHLVTWCRRRPLKLGRRSPTTLPDRCSARALRSSRAREALEVWVEIALGTRGRRKPMKSVAAATLRFQDSRHPCSTAPCMQNETVSQPKIHLDPHIVARDASSAFEIAIVCISHNIFRIIHCRWQLDVLVQRQLDLCQRLLSGKPRASVYQHGTCLGLWRKFGMFFQQSGGRTAI
jgi:hypothetical protein